MWRCALSWWHVHLRHAMSNTQCAVKATFTVVLQNWSSEQKQQERERALRCCTEHNSTARIHTLLVCSCGSSHTERDAERGAAARLMEISLSAALLVQSPTLFQNCSLSSAPIICWMQSWRAMQEQKLCSMTLQKVVPGGKGLSSHYPHKTNNPCCCWTALCSNSGSSALKINLSCYKYEKYSKSDVEEELKIYKWAPQGSKNLVHYGRELKYKWKHVPWIQMSSSYNSDLSKKLGWGGWGLFKKHRSWYCII